MNDVRPWWQCSKSDCDFDARRRANSSNKSNGSLTIHGSIIEVVKALSLETVNISTMKLLSFLLLSLLCPAVAFAPTGPKAQLVERSQELKQSLALLPLRFEEPEDDNEQGVHGTVTSLSSALSSKLITTTGLFSTGLLAFANCAMAGEEIEMAELPPPWVPAIFAVVLLVGVGVLTGSLGNVIDEGT